MNCKFNTEIACLRNIKQFSSPHPLAFEYKTLFLTLTLCWVVGIVQLLILLATINLLYLVSLQQQALEPNVLGLTPIASQPPSLDSMSSLRVHNVSISIKFAGSNSCHGTNFQVEQNGTEVSAHTK